jgi:hypothetical protein
MSENVDGMQTMLNVFSEYCNTWKLQVNVTKTKVVIFSKRRVSQNTRFMSDNKATPLSSKYCSISFIKSEKEKGGRFSNCLTPTLQAK